MVIPAWRRSLTPAVLALAVHVVAPLWVLVGSGQPWTGRILSANAVLLALSTVFGTLAHEAAHAGVARALGVPVRAVFIGRGPAVATFRVAGVPIVFQAAPFTGAAQITPRSERLLGPRLFAIYAAGPLANLALLWLAWSALSPARLGTEVAPGTAFGITQLLMVLMSGLASDGAGMLRAITDPAANRHTLAAWPLLQALEDIRAGRYEAAERRFAEAATYGPATDPAVRLHGSTLAMVHRYAEAVPLLRRGLATATGPDLALTRNNLAWCLAVLREPGTLDEALALALAARAADPAQPSFANTEAAVHLARGDLDRAAELLPTVTQPTGSVAAALTECLFAECHARRGELVAAREHLERAEAVADHDRLPSYRLAAAAVAEAAIGRAAEPPAVA